MLLHEVPQDSLTDEMACEPFVQVDGCALPYQTWAARRGPCEAGRSKGPCLLLVDSNARRNAKVRILYTIP